MDSLEFTNSARPRNFGKEFRNFLGHSFVPSVSPKSNPHRTDFLLEAASLPIGCQNVLDVCCGTSLLLDLLIETAEKGGFPKPGLYYVGVDYAHTEPLRRAQEKQSKRAKEAGIKANFERINISDTGLHGKLSALTGGAGFERIVFANALHEVAENAVPILRALVASLADEGELVIIDPNPEWLFSAETWRVDSLAELKADWEAHGIWLTPYTYSAVLSKLGCTAQHIECKRSSPFYLLKAKKDNSVNEDVTEATRLYCSAIESQHREQHDLYADCRAELVGELSKIADRMDVVILHKGIEFFARATSQARRFEIIEAIRTNE